MSQFFSSKIADAIDNYLLLNDYHYSFDQSRGQFSIDFVIDGETTDYVSCVVDVKCSSFCIDIFSPYTVPAKEIHKMAEFLSRINKSSLLANFKLDYDEGVIALRCFVDCTDRFSYNNCIAESLRVCENTFISAFPGIRAIIDIGMSGLNAFEYCEFKRDEAFAHPLNAATQNYSDEELEALKLEARLDHHIEINQMEQAVEEKGGDQV